MVKTFSPKFLLIGALGFFSGLPLALTASTLTAWLADAKVDRASIGLFAAIATPYALKFLWAPLMDGLRIPILTARMGRRRSWLLVTQALLVAAIALMAGNDPAVNQWLTALFGVIVATLSATQDIVIDAYRVELLSGGKDSCSGGNTPTPPVACAAARDGTLREALSSNPQTLRGGSPSATQDNHKDLQGIGAGWVTLGYRIGMLVSGAGALYLADRIGWHGTYLVMAAVMAAGVVVTLVAKEGKIEIRGNRDKKDKTEVKKDSYFSYPPYPDSPLSRFRSFLRDYVIAPFRDFMTRPQWLAVLAFVILSARYRVYQNADCGGGEAVWLDGNAGRCFCWRMGCRADRHVPRTGDVRIRPYANEFFADRAGAHRRRCRISDVHHRFRKLHRRDVYGGIYRLSQCAV
jgi:MFS transporter, PAT family, beta-lactamase induction signal transducer AmpG